MLIIAAATIAVAFAPLPSGAAPPPTSRLFRIAARQFAYSPGQLRVNPGDTVTIQLVSTDVVHGLYVDGYDISVEADPGRAATLTFVADRPGSFRFRCSVTCGAMHPFMIGQLVVGSRTGLARAIGFILVGALGSVLLGRHTTSDPGSA